MFIYVERFPLLFRPPLTQPGNFNAGKFRQTFRGSINSPQTQRKPFPTVSRVKIRTRKVSQTQRTSIFKEKNTQIYEEDINILVQRY